MTSPYSAAKGIRRALPWDSEEFQASVSRFAVGAVALAFLAAGDVMGSMAVDWGMLALLYGAHLVLFVGVLASVLADPSFKQGRTDLSLAGDLSAITCLIYLSSDPLIPLYLVYIVLYISQGTRFGQRNLMLAAAGSVACYTGLGIFMGAWERAPVESAFVVVTLALLPFYQQSLLKNLQRARRNAEAAKEARGEFLRTMTHELRTPLSGIVGMTRVLERTPLSQEQSRYVASISASANTLRALVGDILDLSKVDAGTLELTEEWFDLRETVAEVCHNLGPQALGKGVELVCRVDGRLPQWLRGDPVRFQQILYNLAGNAVKFTDRGRVSVEADRLDAAGDDGGPLVRVTIGDTGQGISPDSVGYVFDPYWQADSTIVGRYGGSGLGTAIAYRLTSAMGGEVQVESRPGEGTQFQVTLPLLSGDETTDAPPQPPQALAQRRVVIVEADAYAREAMAEACRQAHMTVHEYGYAHHIEPEVLRVGDLVVLADTPDGGDPSNWIRHVRAVAERPVPVLYVGYRGRPLPEGADADASLAKPFQPLELWNGLATALGEAAPTGGVERGGEDGDSSTRRVLVAEDDVVNGELIQTVLRRAGYAVTLVRDGASALRALKAARFDMALVDLRMPEVDGVELTRRIRNGEVEQMDLPVVALSAEAGEGTRSETMAAGIDEYLTKPIDPDRLDDLWRRLVRV